MIESGQIKYSLTKIGKWLLFSVLFKVYVYVVPLFLCKSKIILNNLTQNNNNDGYSDPFHMMFKEEN